MRKIFNLIYLIFSIFLLLASVVCSGIYGVLSFGLLCFLIFLKEKYNKKIDDNKYDKLVNIFIVVLVIIRFSLILLPFKAVYSDYANFYNGAVLFARNGTINKYVETFPHLIGYIISIGWMFKIFGESYKLVILFNVIFDLLTAFLVYKAFNSKKASLVWLLNPVNIIWCYACHTIVITNFFLMFGLILLKKIFEYIDKGKKKNNNKLYMLCFICSYILAIANIYRPIIIIGIIAIVIYIFLKYIINNNVKKVWVVIIIIVGYLGFNSLYDLGVRKFISDNVARNTIGWSLYVGANIDSTGQWDSKLWPEIGNLFWTDMTPTEIQEHFFKKGIDLYKANGIKNNIKLFIDKSFVLVDGVDMVGSYVLKYTTKFNISEIMFNLMVVLCHLFYYLLLISNVGGAYINLRRDKWDFSIILELFSIGLFMGHLITESAPRYIIPLIVPFSLIFIINKDKLSWKKIFENRFGKKEK